MESSKWTISRRFSDYFLQSLLGQFIREIRHSDCVRFDNHIYCARNCGWQELHLQGFSLKHLRTGWKLWWNHLISFRCARINLDSQY